MAGNGRLHRHLLTTVSHLAITKALAGSTLLAAVNQTRPTAAGPRAASARAAPRRSMNAEICHRIEQAFIEQRPDAATAWITPIS
jgi:hypothetical protein